MQAEVAPAAPSTDAVVWSDSELLTLFHRDAQTAWALFIERYADLILSYLRSLGFDADQAMDRFVYVCEKLCEQEFRRLKTVRYVGREGDLTPWIRQVVKHLSINWAWSLEGRRRIFKSIARLPAHEQEIFELYFRRGLSPTEIHERLRAGQQSALEFVDVLSALERIFSLLSSKKIWRLTSELARRRRPVSLEAMDDESGFEPADERADPEQVLIKAESERRLGRALETLSVRERLALQFRYEEGLSIAEVAEVLRWNKRAVQACLRTALQSLRRTLT